jgi:hypothetical protein
LQAFVFFREFLSLVGSALSPDFTIYGQHFQTQEQAQLPAQQ